MWTQCNERGMMFALACHANDITSMHTHATLKGAHVSAAELQIMVPGGTCMYYAQQKKRIAASTQDNNVPQLVHRGLLLIYIAQAFILTWLL